MSADNWATCPRCFLEARAKHKALKKELETAYGRVSLERFEELRRAAAKEPEENETLREDYHVGVRLDATLANASFSVEYKARCVVCSFSFTYKFEQAVQREDAPKPVRTSRRRGLCQGEDA